MDLIAEDNIQLKGMPDNMRKHENYILSQFTPIYLYTVLIYQRQLSVGHYGFGRLLTLMLFRMRVPFSVGIFSDLGSIQKAPCRAMKGLTHGLSSQ